MRYPAFSMIETIFSVLLVGGLLVVALNTAGGAVMTQHRLHDRGVAQMLAQELMQEIMRKPYSDPDDPIVFGLETGETSGPRSVFDDVDDYKDWTEDPPQDPDGTKRTEWAGWKRKVKVEYTTPANLTAKISTDVGVKRITITVDRNGVILATLVAVRTSVPDWIERSR